MMYYCKVKFQPIGGKLYSYKSRLEVSPGDEAEVVVMREGRPTLNRVFIAEVSETVDPKATRYLNRVRSLNRYCTEEYTMDELEIRKMLQNTHYGPIKSMFTPPEGVVMMAREGNIEIHSSVSGTTRPSNKSPNLVLHHEHIKVSNAKVPYPTSFSADFCLGS